MEFTILMIMAALLLIIIIFFYYVPFFLWINALSAGVHISLVQLFLMRLRRVPPRIVVYAMIEAHKAGLKDVTRDNLEAHFLARGQDRKSVV